METKQKTELPIPTFLEGLGTICQRDTRMVETQFVGNASLHQCTDIPTIQALGGSLQEEVFGPAAPVTRQMPRKDLREWIKTFGTKWVDVDPWVDMRLLTSLPMLNTQHQTKLFKDSIPQFIMTELGRFWDNYAYLSTN